MDAILLVAVLRQPWQQPAGSERADDDATATHAMLVDENSKVLGVGRHQHPPTEVQIRFMAIRSDQQGNGLGGEILKYLELIAHKWQVDKITLQARENALNFYRRNGFKIVEKSHLLFGEIQHYKMVKN